MQSTYRAMICIMVSGILWWQYVGNVNSMHYLGYYPTPTFNDHKAAQLLMIENSLRWAYGIDKGDIFNATGSVLSPFKFVDVGCGVGGSSRYIARKVRSELGDLATIKGQGISLSPVQIQRAKEVRGCMSYNIIRNKQWTFVVYSSCQFERLTAIRCTRCHENAHQSSSTKLWSYSIKWNLQPQWVYLIPHKTMCTDV